MKPTVLILRTAGTNCDLELADAFERAGAEPEPVHLNRLIEAPDRLEQFSLMGIPGGFSYGDDIAAGRIFANRLRHRLYEPMRRFIAAGKPIIGVCNGFQLLVKSGLLPGFELPTDRLPEPRATLGDNTDPRFLDRWTPLRVPENTACVWTRGLSEFELPIAHGEGRFIADDATLDRLETEGQLALRYAENPNGSARDIAGICDPTGRVLGLMPHPERFIRSTEHPRWTRETIESPAGLAMFQNAVEAVTAGETAPA